MDLDAVQRALNLGETAEVWRSQWGASDVAPNGWPEAIGEPAIYEACRALQMPPELTGVVLEATTWIRRHAVLERLARHVHWELFQHTSPETGKWPMLPEHLGPLTPMFYAVVYLSGFQRAMGEYRARGVPDQVALATLRDLVLWMHDEHLKRGRWGLTQVGWLVHHFRGRIFQIGRLQYQPWICPWPYHVFRSRPGGRIRVLAGQGMRFRRDGQCDGTNGIHDPDTWESSFEQMEDSWRGHSVNARGEAEPDLVELPDADWERVLKPDDPVLNVHIPAGGPFHGPMSDEACVASLQEAERFFPRYMPELTFKAFVCATWMLDPQLADYLPRTSNIVRFQRRFHLLPLPGADDRQTLERVFAGAFPGLESAPQDTSLQRIVVRHMREGGRWRQAGGIRLRGEAY